MPLYVCLRKEEGVSCNEPGLPPGTRLQVSTVCPSTAGVSHIWSSLSVWGRLTDPWGGWPFLPYSMGSVYVCLKLSMSAFDTSSNLEWAPFLLKTKISNSEFLNFH